MAVPSVEQAKNTKSKPPPFGRPRRKRVCQLLKLNQLCIYIYIYIYLRWPVNWPYTLFGSSCLGFCSTSAEHVLVQHARRTGHKWRSNARYKWQDGATNKFHATLLYRGRTAEDRCKPREQGGGDQDGSGVDEHASRWRAACNGRGIARRTTGDGIHATARASGRAEGEQPRGRERSARR